MGLVSLPYLNRVGVYTYWNNVWDNSFNYRHYFFFEIFINFFFYRFFEDLTFNFLFNFLKLSKKKTKGGYISLFKSMSNFDLNIYIYLGKIWLFCYQGWYILKVVLLLPSKELRKSASKNINLVKINKLFLRNLKSIKYSNKYIHMNYKYKV